MIDSDSMLNIIYTEALENGCIQDRSIDEDFKDDKNKIIDRITVTGADDSTQHIFLFEVAKNFPMVEFGILVSRNSYGCPRFPSQLWLKRLNDLYKIYSIFSHINPYVYKLPQLSCHLCGQMVRDLCSEGNISFKDEIPIDIFNRIQLNFHSYLHLISRNKFVEALQKFPEKQFIFQFDGVNDEILEVAKDAGINAVPLFDKSGGAGIVPGEWPIRNGYSGYAGGLSPENIDEQMKKISLVAQPGMIWIDAETRLRSRSDMIFDEDKVIEFVNKAAKYCQV